MRWTSINQATQEQWLNDRATCYIETQRQLSAAGVDQTKIKPNSANDPICRPFNACLAARGYVRSDAAGTLTIPGDAPVQCALPNP